MSIFKGFLIEIVAEEFVMKKNKHLKLMCSMELSGDNK